ncbi:MAG: carbon storage regulator [Bryobacteraceae bacterium]|nr:carbon storage regulator [Bryobacteraceae bacterium]
MLVISRKPGESVLLGDEVELRVIDIAGGRVKLGITAPRALPILRKEMKLAADTNEAAARPITPEALTNLVHRLRNRA